MKKSKLKKRIKRLEEALEWALDYVDAIAEVVLAGDKPQPAPDEEKDSEQNEEE